MTNQTNPQQPLLPATRQPVPPAPIHPLAALATIVLDNVFGVVEIVDPLALILTSVSVGVIGAVTTTFVQRFLAKDEWGAAVAKGLVMGIHCGGAFPGGGNGSWPAPAGLGRPARMDQIAFAEKGTGTTARFR